jgi:alpha-beta hydrolase superfamily lysophospholipase
MYYTLCILAMQRILPIVILVIPVPDAKIILINIYFMEVIMEKRVWRAPAANGVGTIYCVLLRDETTAPRAIINLVHGMQSHLGRYDALSEELARRGFIVIRQDLQGHGHSANVSGSFGEKDGWQAMLHDLRRMNHLAQKWFPGLPMIMFGHSMGSFLARDFASRYPKELDGLILSGTAGENYKIRIAYSYLATEYKIHGSMYDGHKYTNKMAEIFLKDIPNPVNSYAWCSTDEETCRMHEHDPLACHLTLGACFDVLKGLLGISGTSWAKKVPDIPIYIFSGGADPVGDYGIGPAQVYAWLKGTGHKDVSLRIYPGKRHEMLMETNREKVKQALFSWIDAHF